MTFLIEYEAAFASLAFGLMIAFLVGHFRYHMGIRDALFKDMLPFMWALCAAVSALELLTQATVDVVQGDTWSVALELFNAGIYGYWSYRWFHIWKNEGDDTWKKRRRRIAEKIALVSGRLVPVPVN